eukprot:10267752-Ditylum_brightwellii.AAC.1
MMMHKDWVAEIVDVETAFLYGDMDVEMYMKVPEGLEHIEPTIDRRETSMVLEKSLYGTVQAARQWWKKFMSVLETKLGFERSKVDACLLIRKDTDGTVIICTYVDDAALIGDQKAIDKAKEQLEQEFRVKKLGSLTEYVGVTVRRDGDTLYLSQPDVIDRMERYFKEEVSNMKKFQTPMPQSHGVVRPTEDEETLSQMEQS